MNCRNAFQIYWHLENCMTNRVSLLALKQGIATYHTDNFQKNLSCIDICLT